MMKQVTGYHFTGSELRDGQPVPKVGEWLKHNGQVYPCVTGLHASRHAFDALQFAPGTLLHRVILRGGLRSHGWPINKYVGRERKILKTINAENLLNDFARWAAQQVVHLWNAPQIVKDFLKTGDESPRSAAWAAAESAAESATRSATESAAAAAAWSAAMAAAESCESATAAATRSATESAAAAAAWAAAMAAAESRESATAAAAWAAAWAAAMAAAGSCESAAAAAAWSAAWAAAESRESAAAAAAWSAAWAAAESQFTKEARREFSRRVNEAFKRKLMSQ